MVYRHLVSFTRILERYSTTLRHAVELIESLRAELDEKLLGIWRWTEKEKNVTLTEKDKEVGFFFKF